MSTTTIAGRVMIVAGLTNKSQINHNIGELFDLINGGFADKRLTEVADYLAFDRPVI